MIIATLVSLCVIAILLILYFRTRGGRDKRQEPPSNQNKFDTTLGEFHDMREALRPSQHTRAASRTVPRDQKSARVVDSPERRRAPNG